MKRKTGRESHERQMNAYSATMLAGILPVGARHPPSEKWNDDVTTLVADAHQYSSDLHRHADSWMNRREHESLRRPVLPKDMGPIADPKRWHNDNGHSVTVHRRSGR